MKSKILLLSTVALLYLVMETNAQKIFFPIPHSINEIPFGKKFPPLPLNKRDEVINKMYSKKKATIPITTFDTALKQFVTTTPGSSQLQLTSMLYNRNNKPLPGVKNTKSTASNFHLTKDINSATLSSNPYGFAVLNNVAYFGANDGISGSELWRSDGTQAGTSLVKNIVSASDSGGDVNGMIAANNLLYFAAFNSIYGREPWVSDGTEAGTHLLMDINTGSYDSNPNQFVNVNGTVFFCTSISTFGYNNQLWKTDGTEAGTMLVKDLEQAGLGSQIFELTAVNNIAYFIAYTPDTGYQLFLSDGTNAGTYKVKDIGNNYLDTEAPMRLTAYNNKLYFLADDGNGRKLWESDGTYNGTNYATGFNDVIIQNDFINIYSNKPFPVLNNILYLPAYTVNGGSGLYKYNASNTDGIVLVKGLAPDIFTESIDPQEMCVVNDAIYFKVISAVGNYHVELWQTKGETANTQIVQSLTSDESIYGLYNGGGTLYFEDYNPVYGTELWKSNGTGIGTTILKDIVPGVGNSNPSNLTFFNGKLMFTAEDNPHGYELWASDGTTTGTALVKDINSLSDGSGAGFFYKGIGVLGDGVVFNAFTPELGGELYKSDGTTAGTVLLNNISAGADWSYPNSFQFKNNVSYFIGNNDAVTTAIYKTDGTTTGLRRVIANINRQNYSIVNFNITDNGQIFYVLNNVFSGYNELWHSDGNEASSIMLNAFLDYYNNNTAIIGNTAYFQAGDDTYGYELWKSDGSLLGTKLVKDINPGYDGSYPYSLFAYKNNIYFGAYDALSHNNSLWKSDGTEKGTQKLMNIIPGAFREDYLDPALQIFCESQGTLYFTATDFNTYGGELWKTNGTAEGTKLVKDINPYNSSNPSNLTDVNGTLFFIADDGTHGNELWSTKGTAQSTRITKDITPNDGSSNLTDLCLAGGKLYFINRSGYSASLWSSDGEDANTLKVNDSVVNGLSDFSHLTAAGKNKLFFGGYSKQFGTELYEGTVGDKTFTAARVATIETSKIEEENTAFQVLLYPNPILSASTLFIKGNTNNIVVSMIDISGKTIWQNNYTNRNRIDLPVEKLSSGVYMVTVKSNTDTKTIKFIKE